MAGVVEVCAVAMRPDAVVIVSCVSLTRCEVLVILCVSVGILGK